MILRPIIDAALDLIYPRIYCVICGSLLEKSSAHGLCSSCCSSMPFIKAPRCEGCSKPLKHDSGRLCPDCSRTDHYFDAGLSVFEYTAKVKELIYRYKYHREFSLGRTFASFMTQLYKDSGREADLVIPVPLHKNRLKSRGFNQAALLADYVAFRRRLPCADNVLIRRLDTGTQTSLGRRERAENLKNAFEIVKPAAVENRNILLIDDVYTTGATSDCCSRVLKMAGAERVYVLTVATGRNI